MKRKITAKPMKTDFLIFPPLFFVGGRPFTLMPREETAAHDQSHGHLYPKAEM
jgi:hypothetical protein